LFSGLCRGRLDCWVADVSIAMLLSSSELVNKRLFTSSEEDSSMAIETSATQQSRRPRHNPENNNPIDNGRENLHSIIFHMSNAIDEKIAIHFSYDVSH
jgi:hypothetical protein